MRGRRIFDWRFVVALAFLMLVVTATWGFVERNEQTNSLISIAERTTGEYNRLAEQNEALSAQVAGLTEIVEAQSRALRRQARQQAALDAYLRDLGVVVPQTLAPDDSGGTSRPKAAGPRGPKPRPKPPTSPGPTATPAPTTPGVLDPVCGLVPVPLICP